MMERVEQACGRRLAVDSLYRLATIEHLANALTEQEGPALQSPVVPIQTGGRKLPFFFFHGDFNGGGFYCRKLAGLMGEDQPFYALPPLGADGAPVPSTIEEMAELQMRDLKAFCPQGPYLLGGFCNGGLVAFEIARRLQAEGQEVRFVAVIYASAVNARYRSLQRILRVAARLTGPSRDEQLDGFIRFRSRTIKFGEACRYYRRRLVEALDKGIREQARLFIRAPRSLKRTVSRLLFDKETAGGGDSELPGAEPSIDWQGASRRTAARLKLTESYNRLMDGYVPDRYESRLTLFWPTDAPPEEINDPTMGWRRVSGRVDVRAIRGAHLTCITRHVDSLAEQLRESLREAQSSHSLR
jgi:thioesterase domain-containing protein